MTLPVLIDLGEGDKTEFGIAGSDELVRLSDVFTLHYFGLHGLPQAHFFEGLLRGQSVRSQFRRCDGNVIEWLLFQYFPFIVHIAGFCGPECQFAESVG